MPNFIISYEYYPNCPIHEGGNYTGLKSFETIDDIKSWLLENLNTYGLLDCLSLHGSPNISVQYHRSSHSFSGISLFIDQKDELGLKITYRTVDDGSGNLIWKEIE